jgi:hypothetical protein
MKNNMKNSSGPSPLTSQAVLEPNPEQLKLLWAYGAAYGRAVREVYGRSVVGEEEWFVKGEKELRSELIARGWSQREANSIYKTATAAQESAVESTKLSLELKHEELIKVRHKLTKAPIHKRHGLARRRAKLTSKITKFEQLLEDDRVRVCFGSRRLLRATREWDANGYSSQAQAHAVWARKRAGMIYVEGDKEFLTGNASLRLQLSESGDKLRLRVPSFLKHLSDGKAEVEIAVRGLAAKQGRAALEVAMTRDSEAYDKRLKTWQLKPQAEKSKNPPSGVTRKS